MILSIYRSSSQTVPCGSQESHTELCNMMRKKVEQRARLRGMHTVHFQGFWGILLTFCFRVTSWLWNTGVNANYVITCHCITGTSGFQTSPIGRKSCSRYSWELLIYIAQRNYTYWWTLVLISNFDFWRTLSSSGVLLRPYIGSAYYMTPLKSYKLNYLYCFIFSFRKLPVI